MHSGTLLFREAALSMKYDFIIFLLKISLPSCLFYTGIISNSTSDNRNYTVLTYNVVIKICTDQTPDNSIKSNKI